MLSNTNEIIESFKDQLEKAARQSLISRGVEKNSDLVKTLEFKEQGGAFSMIVNDYYQYVSTGRRPRARKVPIMDLVKWIKDEGIRPRPNQSINQLAFAIQTSIFKNGIKGKNFIENVIETVSDVAEVQMADALEQELLNELDKLK